MGLFNRHIIPLIDLAKKEDAELTEALQTLSQLYSLAGAKFNFVSFLIKQKRHAGVLEKTKFGKVSSFVEKNHQLLESSAFTAAKIRKLIKLDKELRKEGKSLFWSEIETLEEAQIALQQLKKIVRKQQRSFSALSQLSREEWGYSQKFYALIIYLAKLVAQEMKLLKLESEDLGLLEQNTKEAETRLMSNRALPLARSAFYHASNYIFNVGDIIRPYRYPRSEEFKVIERIFEKIRAKEFSYRPSRLNCIFVSRDPEYIKKFGKVYAVEVEGLNYFFQGRNPPLSDKYRVHEADMYDIDRAMDVFGYGEGFENKNDIEQIEECARDYWKDPQDREKGLLGGIIKMREPEILVDGTVRVIGLADVFKSGDKVIITKDIVFGGKVYVTKGTVGSFREYEGDRGYRISVPLKIPYEGRNKMIITIQPDYFTAIPAKERNDFASSPSL